MNDNDVMNPDTMTVADCIAWLARDDGWTQDNLGWWNHPTRKKKIEVGQYFFPYVADLKFGQMHTSNDFSIRILIEKNKVSVSAVLASNMGHADDIVLDAVAEDGEDIDYDEGTEYIWVFCCKLATCCIK